MPFLDHNDPNILGFIKHETELIRDQLRRLRHLVEQGHIIDPPLNLITDLGRHAALLSHEIEQYTIRHEYIGPTGNSAYSTYESVMAFVDHEAHENPAYLTYPVHWDYDIYRELGFSEQEYEDLLVWKQAWQEVPVDMKEAFDIFVTKVVADMQAGRYDIKVEDIVPGLAGIVGIAVDIALFVPSAVPVLVSSCATGLAAIASKFSIVRNKLLGKESQPLGLGL